MEILDNIYGAFSIGFQAGKYRGLLVILPEMGPSKPGISPTGQYFIYCNHPKRGSCTFIVEQHEDNTWYSNVYPNFLEPELISWIGKQIESHT